MENRPTGKEYRGPTGVARDSIWLTNEDLPHDKDVVLTIEKVMRYRNVKFQGGRTKDNVVALRFNETQRELGLNATNRKRLAKLFDSNDAGAYYGQRITLYVEQNVRYPDGTNGPAVRIRPQLPEQDHELPEDQGSTAHDEIDEEFNKAAQQAQED